MKRALLIASSSLVLACLFGVLLFLWDWTPTLTREALEEAATRWSRSGTTDYELRLRVEGDRAVNERFRVVVRSGKKVEGERNGAPLPAASAQAYTVDGLIEIMRDELRNAAAPPPGAPRQPLLRASFDRELGYPLVFERIASEGMSRFIRTERFTKGAP